MSVYAGLDPESGDPVYLRSLEYRGRSESGGEEQLRLPPTLAPGNAPFELVPWPADLLIERDLLPRWGSLAARARFPAWSQAEVVIEYALSDDEESFWEGNDGMWLREKVISTAPESELTLQEQPLEDLDGDWEDLLPAEGWVEGRFPDARVLSGLWMRRDSAGDLVVRAGRDPVEVGPELAELFELLPESEPELSAELTLAAGGSSGCRVEMATLVRLLWREVASQWSHVDTTYWLRRGPEPSVDGAAGGCRESGWRSVELGAVEAETTVVRLDALDVNGSHLLALTDRAGFRESRDGGENWRDFNFGEPRLLDGRAVRTAIAGSAPPALYALVVSPASAGEPPPTRLFRYRLRPLAERLRLGLIRLLGGSG